MEEFETEAGSGAGSKGVGMALAYHSMPNAVVQVVKYLFRQDLTEVEEQRMIDVTTRYSKSAIHRKDKPHNFKSDS